MSTLAIAAFDPGKTGAICIMDINGEFLDLTPMPKTGKELRDYVQRWAPSIRMAYVERVGYIPGDGPQGSFTFGMGYGRILQCLDDHGVLYDLVDPRVWQASMKCMTGGDKRVTTAKAKSLWPSRDWTKVNSDAAIMARWGINQILDAQAQKERRMGK